VAFADPTSLSTRATCSQPGTYTVSLTASDSELVASATTTITLRLPNAPPSVDAGSAQRITFPTNTATLAGTATDDGFPEPSRLTLEWTQLSGPAGAATFADAAVASTTASFSAPGIYVLRLSANDGELTASSDVTITNLGTGTATFTLSVAGGDTSVAYSLSAGSVTLAAGGSSTVTVTMTAAKGAAAGGHSGSLEVGSGSGAVAHAVLYTLIK
jgi:PKD repeat protein